jgi:cell division cycle protein 20 (cofactor of APC complex)
MVLGEIRTPLDLTSGSFPSPNRGKAPGSRYIPQSVSDTAKLKLKENLQPKDEYEGLLATNLLGAEESQDRVLTYSERPPAPAAQDTLKVLYCVGKEARDRTAKIARVIPSESLKTLDAPDLLDDFYLKLVDWSSQNIVSVALGHTVYLWNGENGQTEALAQLEHDCTSLRWAADGMHLALGEDTGLVSLYDASAGKKLRTLTGHGLRVAALCWNDAVLTSGSKDGAIFHHDVRAKDHLVAKLAGHEQEVCGLEWSPDGSHLASGGNDNTVRVFRGLETSPARTLAAHTAAVKALAWCPWQRNLLATGGGSADRAIRFWNTQSGACLNSVDTGSQVSDLKWSLSDKELVSSHGFSQNQLCVWKWRS